MSLGDRIAEERRSRGWSRFMLSAVAGLPAVGIKDTGIAKIESGEIVPERQVLGLIAQALGVRIETLTQGAQ